MATTTTNQDAYIINAVDYYPYGKVLRKYDNGAGDRYLTTQHERDGETGLDYRGARYYDSDVARFLSLDPLSKDFPAWSSYNYVKGNPIIFIDPTGRSPENSAQTKDPRKDEYEINKGKNKGGWTKNHIMLNEAFGDQFGFNKMINNSTKNPPPQLEVNNEWLFDENFVGPLPEDGLRVSQEGLTRVNSLLSSSHGSFPGVTFIETSWLGGRGMTLGSTIYIRTDGYDWIQTRDLKRHEYGHFLQYLLLGADMKVYLSVIGLPSVGSASLTDTHRGFWTEVWANRLSKATLGIEDWNSRDYPLTYR